jgi:hypothetical protein
MPSPEPAIIEDDQSGFPLIEPSQAPPEIQACLSDIQDTLGIPWIPASCRAYAMYPKDVLPELIVQDALFHMGLANLKPVTKL